MTIIKIIAVTAFTLSLYTLNFGMLTVLLILAPAVYLVYLFNAQKKQAAYGEDNE